MRIGVMSGATGGPDGQLDGLIARVKDLEARGFHSIWMANIFGLDAITAAAIAPHVRSWRDHFFANWLMASIVLRLTFANVEMSAMAFAFRSLPMARVLASGSFVSCGSCVVVVSVRT